MAPAGPQARGTKAKGSARLRGRASAHALILSSLYRLLALRSMIAADTAAALMTRLLRLRLLAMPCAIGGGFAAVLLLVMRADAGRFALVLGLLTVLGLVALLVHRSHLLIVSRFATPAMRTSHVALDSSRGWAETRCSCDVSLALASKSFGEQCFGIRGAAIARPDDVLVRPYQRELRLIRLAAAGLGVADHFQRHVQRMRGVCEGTDICVGGPKSEQREALAEFLERILARGQHLRREMMAGARFIGVIAMRRRLAAGRTGDDRRALVVRLVAHEAARQVAL